MLFRYAFNKENVIMKKTALASLLILLNFVSPLTLMAATLTTTDTTASSMTSTDLTTATTTSQNLIDTQNALLDLTASTIDPAAQSLLTTLKSSTGYLSDFNLLYATSITSTGTISTSDLAVVSSVVSQTGYTQDSYLVSVARGASLYRTIQGNLTYLTNFNIIYSASLPATGSPGSTNRAKLFTIVKAPDYNKTTFLGTLTTATPTPSPGGQLFSTTSVWNKKLSTTNTVLSNSAALVSSLVADTKITSPWINTTSYSTPLYKVGTSTPKVPVYIVQNGVVLVNTTLNTETQKGVRIPVDVIAASGRDGHLTIYDTSTDTLYEFWRFKVANGRYEASWGGILYNASTSNGAMPVVTNKSGGKEYWGATATGLPAIGGTMLLKEVQAGVIPHALAFAMINPKNTFVSPATRSDGPSTALNAVPEGTRFRFPSNIYIDPNWAPIIKMMVVAVRDYGMVLRDRSGAVTFYAEDTTPTYGTTNPYTPYYTGGAVWSTIGQFPWDKLIAVT